MKTARVPADSSSFFSFLGFAAALFLGMGIAATDAAAGPHTTSAGGEIKPALIYHNYCSVCHGDKGDGRSRAQGSLNPPPRDFTSAAVANQLTRDYMIAIVRNGKAGTAMTGWHTQLNQKEIEAVVDYVRNAFMPASANRESSGDAVHPASRGRNVYARNCSVCHGDKGDGRSRAQASLNPPPRDFTSPSAKSELNRERMLKSVTYGRPDTAMAGFKTQLNADDIEAVVDYIRSGFMGDTSTAGISGIRHGKRQGVSSMPATPTAPPARLAAYAPPAADMAAAMPSGLKGDAVKGAAFYMNNCAACHGTTGDGRGPRAYFINPKPRNFLHAASRNEFNRVALYNAIAHGKLGTDMPAWDKVLEPQEIADVSEFVFQRFIRQTAAGGKQAKK